MRYMDRLYRARTSELWRDLEELDYLISRCMKNGYYEKLTKYLGESLIIFKFLKRKPKFERKEFLQYLENMAYYYNYKENFLESVIFSDSAFFFKREFIDK